MEANLELTVEGVRGGHARSLGRKASVGIHVDFDYLNDQVIYVDAFQGKGETYARMEKCVISIYANQGECVFLGTFEELVNHVRIAKEHLNPKP